MAGGPSDVLDNSALVWDFKRQPERGSPNRSASVRAGVDFRLHAAARRALAQPLKDDIEHRDHEKPEQGRGEHAAEHRRSDRTPAERAGARRDDLWQQAKE